VRNTAHFYGFAAFTVDPGSHRGDITTIKVTYYEVAGQDVEQAPFETSRCAAPPRLDQPRSELAAAHAVHSAPG
jgi:hypothetical protein